MAYEKKIDAQASTTIKLGGDGNPTSIEGYYLTSKDTPDSGYGPGKLHIFMTKEGNVGVWGKTNINRLLTDDLKGKMCLLTFTGMGPKRKGRNPAYEYELQFDRSNTVDVTHLAAAVVDDGESDEEYVANTPTSYEDVDSDDDTPVVTSKAAVPNAAAQAKVKELLAKAQQRRA